MFHDDETGMLLVGRIIVAANRGERVLPLFDDWNIAGKDFSLSMFNAQPNIKVRVFNPMHPKMASRSGSSLTGNSLPPYVRICLTFWLSIYVMAFRLNP